MEREEVSTDALAAEARHFGMYLVKTAPPESAIALYKSAVKASGVVATDRDQRLLSFMARHPWSIGLIDGGLALIDRQSAIRHRLYVMFSILETRPEYTAYFLPRQRSAWYAIAVLFIGAAGVLKSLAGVLIIKAVAR